MKSDKTLSILLHSNGKFSSLLDARAGCVNIAKMSDEDVESVSMQMAIDAQLVRGAVVLAKHILDAFNWFDSHKLEISRDSLVSAISGFKAESSLKALPGSNQFAVMNGARFLLHRTLWDRESKSG